MGEAVGVGMKPAADRQQITAGVRGCNLGVRTIQFPIAWGSPPDAVGRTEPKDRPDQGTKADVPWFFYRRKAGGPDDIRPELASAVRPADAVLYCNTEKM